MAGPFRGRDPNAPTRPVAAAPRTDTEVREFLRQMPRYRVVLHNDSQNTMDHVVSSLLRCVPSLTATVAERVMLEAHTTGRAVVISCLKEQAEYYCERLQTCGLTATMEPA
jgi:ATP-dependent Clp protease adaptor protein ClpS